jgi:diguanylate cyclase
MVGIWTGIRDRAQAWLSPPVPDAVRPALQLAQLNGLRMQAPMLLGVAALNVIIIMAVCAHQGFPLASYGWMSALIVYCIFRVFTLTRRLNRPLSEAGLTKLVRRSTLATVVMLACLGLVTVYTFVAGTFSGSTLIPMSLSFGAVSIAHCLYTMRPAAIGAITLGVFPAAIGMMAVGPFEARMLSLAMASVGILMMRFVTEQNDQLVISLGLAEENRRLAMTDALTGIANRRAIMTELDREAAAGNGYALALIDLDGFKQVNDAHGHHAGDHLLREVATRLSQAAGEGDNVGRLGGDEFILIFRGNPDQADCTARANAALASLSRPVELEGLRLVFGASLGFAIAGQHGDSVEALLNSADEALYVVKRNEGMAVSSMPCVVRLAA